MAIYMYSILFLYFWGIKTQKQSQKLSKLAKSFRAAVREPVNNFFEK